MEWKDKTSAFRSLVAKKQQMAPRQNPVSTPQRSPFQSSAHQIAMDIAKTSAMLQRLAELAKVKSLFNDPVVEIQQLTYVVKQEITGINRKLEGLKTMAGKNTKQTAEHSEHVVSNLSSKLQGTTQSFQNVLELRAENLRKQQEDKARFTGSEVSLFSAPAASSDSSSLYSSTPSFLDDTSGGGALAQQQQFAPTQYDQRARLDAAEAIEETMVELGGIMQELAVMVEEQGQVIARIDDNVHTSLHNVMGAQDELMKVLDGVMGNKKLILQMFLVFIVFLVVFLVFFV